MGIRFAAWAMALGTVLSMGCVGIPENLKPVEPFEATRYLEKWYEIARFDHSFERGLTKVTATYSLRRGGGLQVANQGWSPKKNKWKYAKGKAFFVQNPGHRPGREDPVARRLLGATSDRGVLSLGGLHCPPDNGNGGHRAFCDSHC